MPIVSWKKILTPSLAEPWPHGCHLSWNIHSWSRQKPKQISMCAFFQNWNQVWKTIDLSCSPPLLTDVILSGWLNSQMSIKITWMMDFCCVLVAFFISSCHQTSTTVFDARRETQNEQMLMHWQAPKKPMIVGNFNTRSSLLATDIHMLDCVCIRAFGRQSHGQQALQSIHRPSLLQLLNWLCPVGAAAGSPC